MYCDDLGRGDRQARIAGYAAGGEGRIERRVVEVDHLALGPLGAAVAGGAVRLEDARSGVRVARAGER